MNDSIQKGMYHIGPKVQALNDVILGNSFVHIERELYAAIVSPALIPVHGFCAVESLILPRIIQPIYLW